MKKVQLILKVTNGCNLRCKYCYNGGKHFKEGIMGPEIVDKAISLFDGFDCIQVIFHGGEPMLGGLSFYQKVLEIEDYYTAKRGVVFDNVVQTNATLIDDKWLSFFKKNRFSIGISFDGIDNESYRGETAKVLSSLTKIRKAKVPVNAIAVVSNPKYDIGANYDYFKSLDLGVDFAFAVNEGSAKEIDLMSNKDYTDQMAKLFKRWIYDKDGTPVRNFIFTLRKIFHCCKEYCGNGSCVGNFFCVDTDGTIYGCSHESVKQFAFGNVMDMEKHHDIINTPMFKTYLLGSINRRKVCMEKCTYFDYCKGGCVDYALLGGDINKPNEEYCYQFKTLFNLAKATVDEIFEKKIPLNELNPSFRKVLAESADSREMDK